LFGHVVPLVLATAASAVFGTRVLLRGFAPAGRVFRRGLHDHGPK